MTFDIFSVSAGVDVLVVVVAIILGAWRIRQNIDKRDTELEMKLLDGEGERKVILAEISGFKEDLKKEFGGNSGGMREAINRISDTVDRVDSKTNDLAVELGELRGRFEQHMEMNKS